jgi:ribosomal protein L5
VRDRIPADLVAALQADATGTVKDFKVTDGKGIGVVVALNNGTTTWFFDDEITAA